MNHQQFDKRPERQPLTRRELKALVDLWNDERGELQGVDAPATTADAAEVLEITPGEALRLLSLVRARRDAARRRRRRIAASVALVAAGVGLGGGLLLVSKPKVGTVPAPLPAQMAPMPVLTVAPGGVTYEQQLHGSGLRVWASRITLRNGNVIFAEGDVKIRAVKEAAR